MNWLLHLALAHVARGNLQVTTARGTTLSFGDGSAPPIAVRFTSAAAQRAVLLDPDLKLGEAYMDGTFVVERGSRSCACTTRKPSRHGATAPSPTATKWRSRAERRHTAIKFFCLVIRRKNEIARSQADGLRA
jgi:hypothetical protein